MKEENLLIGRIIFSFATILFWKTKGRHTFLLNFRASSKRASSSLVEGSEKIISKYTDFAPRLARVLAMAACQERGHGQRPILARSESVISIMFMRGSNCVGPLRWKQKSRLDNSALFKMPREDRMSVIEAQITANAIFSKTAFLNSNFYTSVALKPH